MSTKKRQEHGMFHTRGQPYHPTTQGRSSVTIAPLKNRILLEHYYLPGELEARLAESTKEKKSATK
jgi:putative transposase